MEFSDAAELPLAANRSSLGESPPLVPTSPSSQGPDRSRLSQFEEEYRELRQQVLSIATARVAALRRLTALRRANEDLQNSFATLEKHLPPSAGAAELVFADERQSTDARVTLGRGSPSIEQVLPVESTGLSAIELNFSDVALSRDSVLRIQLRALEEQRVLDQWTISPDELVAGWAMLPLTQPPVGDTRTLVLRLDLETSGDTGLSLFLGRLQPVRLFQLRNATTGTALRANALSMRLWCGEPANASGVKTTILLPDPPRVASNGASHVPLSQSLLAGAALANDDDVRFDFAPVSHFPYRFAVACHPPARGMTIATVPLPAGWRVRGVAAEVEVGNDQSRAVEFALVIAKDVARAKDLLAAGAVPSAEEAVSVWIPVAFGERKGLEAVAREPAKGRTQLFLATRMAAPGNNNFAWARFLNLSIESGAR